MGWKIKINPDGPLFHAEQRQKKMTKQINAMFDNKPKKKKKPLPSVRKPGK